MAEQEEYKLPEISEEQIEKAAMPVGKRVNEDVSEETQYIELDDNKDELKPLQEDDVKEDFETSQKVVARWRLTLSIAHRSCASTRSRKSLNLVKTCSEQSN